MSTLPEYEKPLADWVDAQLSEYGVTACWADSHGAEESEPYVLMTRISNVEHGHASNVNREIVTERKFTLGDVVEGESRILVVNRFRAEHVVQAGESVNDVRDALVTAQAAHHGTNLVIEGLGGDGEIRVRRGSDLASLFHASAYPPASWTNEQVETAFVYQVVSRRRLRVQFDIVADPDLVGDIDNDLQMALLDTKARADLKAAGINWWSNSPSRPGPRAYSDAERQGRLVFDATFQLTATRTSAGPKPVQTATVEGTTT